MRITYQQLVELAFFVKSKGFDEVFLQSDEHDKYAGFTALAKPSPKEMILKEMQETQDHGNNS